MTTVSQAILAVAAGVAGSLLIVWGMYLVLDAYIQIVNVILGI